MKNQVLFSSKDKSKKLKCRLLQFLFGALRVKKFSPASRRAILLSLLLVPGVTTKGNHMYVLFLSNGLENSSTFGSIINP